MTLYEELKARGLVAQITDDEIIDLINNGKATFYIGFDCTADSLTAGHFMALTLMKRLQMAGNKPIALIGGGTTMIGDPSGRTDMRKMLTKDDIAHNAACFKKQMEKFIDFSEGKALMLNNADWLLNLNYVELLREVGACFSVNNMLRAECYKQRMEKGLSFLEFNYMIMQSYDFYYMFQHYGCNMQFGGDDQWSNMLGGTELIRRKLGKDAYAMTVTLLTDSQGKKMGKTAGNAVWLDPNKTSPFEFYQYWRNVDDADVLKCIRMLTFLPLEEIDVETPVATAHCKHIAGKKLAIVPILRAGLGMVDGMVTMMPNVKVGHIGLFRDPKTLEPVKYYFKMPPDISERDVIIVDPMLATGGSASAAVQFMKEVGCKHIKLMCIIGAPEGVAVMQKEHPDVDIYVAALDDHLNEHGYIVPGLGDAGDRIFGTK